MLGLKVPKHYKKRRNKLPETDKSFKRTFKGRKIEGNAGNLQKVLYRFSRGKHTSLQY